MHQMDVRTAFLHGEIDETVHITAPEGFILCKPNEILKLRRVPYGLKQAPRLWHKKWLSVMDKLGFHKLLADPCIFHRGNVWVLLYIDDITLIRPQLLEIEKFQKQLESYLDVKDLGILR